MHGVNVPLVGWTNSQCHSSFHTLFMTLFLFLFSDISRSILPVIDMKERDRLIKQYFQMGYTYNEIIGFLFCVHGIMLSLRTLKRTLRRMGLKKNGTEAPISVIVQTVVNLQQQGYINLGYRAMWKLLNVVCGIRATQNTVMRVLKAVTPNNVADRSRHRLQRRIYYNKGPNFLIHIDGYDKLKPFGIAIHGAIDGYSRKILWLKASNTNNNPRVVARYYMEYIHKIQGVPRVVRSDAGTENCIIKDLQILFRSHHRDAMQGEKSFQTGTSTSNQRIEMLWSFLMKNFTSFWRNLFKDLRDNGLFSNSNAFNVNCLRFCFLPLIQHRLDVFKSMWNNHRIRSQRHTEVPCGVPEVLFSQPLMYGDRDFSFSLPFNSDYVRILTDFCTELSDERGCSEDFWYQLQVICGVAREEIRRVVPFNIEEAISLYQLFIEL